MYKLSKYRILSNLRPRTDFRSVDGEDKVMMESAGTKATRFAGINGGICRHDLTQHLFDPDKHPPDRGDEVLSVANG